MTRNAPRHETKRVCLVVAANQSPDAGMFPNWLRAMEIRHSARTMGVARVNGKFAASVWLGAIRDLLGCFAAELQIGKPGVDAAFAQELGVRSRFHYSARIQDQDSIGFLDGC